MTRPQRASDEPDRLTSMREARAEGQTLDEIAKDWGITRERVRQLLKRAGDAPTRASDVLAAKRYAELAQLLVHPVTLTALMERFGWEDRSRFYKDRLLFPDLPWHHVIVDPPDRAPYPEQHSAADLETAAHRIWAVVKGQGHTMLTTPLWDANRHENEPTHQVFFLRESGGGWAKAMTRYGIPFRPSYRPSYEVPASETLITAIEDYVRWELKEGHRKLSYNGYEAYTRLVRPDQPSAATVRNRLRLDPAYGDRWADWIAIAVENVLQSTD